MSISCGSKKKHLPYVNHLVACRDNAKSKGQHRRADDITNIISREALKDRYSEVRRSTFERKGGGKVFKVERRELDGTTTVFDSKETIEAVAGQTIGERYRLAYSAPIMANPELLRDVGFAGDGEAIESILRGTYVFPPATDEHTIKLLMLEAAVMFCSLGESEIEDMRGTATTSRTSGGQHGRKQSPLTPGATSDTMSVHLTTTLSQTYMSPVSTPSER